MNKKIAIFLLMLSAYLNAKAQCEYYEDSISLRTVGSSSAPSCNGSFTYCSKNGYSVFPHTGYRVLNLMINIIYDVNASYDPLASAGVGAWNPGTPNTINSNPPSYLASFMDQDFTMLPPQGIMTRKYYESSFGAFHIVGDFVIVDINHSTVNQFASTPAGSPFSFNSLVGAAVNLINNSGGLSTIFNHNNITDYDFTAIGSPGLPKSLVSNGKIDFIQILMRNSTPSYGNRSIG